MRKFLLATLATAILAAAAPAAAGGGHTWPVGHGSFQVRFDDLDLQTPAGRAEALRRVEAAATRVCQKAGVVRARDACRQQTVEAAGRSATGPALRRAMAERTSVTTWAAKN